MFYGKRSSLLEHRSEPREIGNVLHWSPRCREHFSPWRSIAKDAPEAHAIAEAGITKCHTGYLAERSNPRYHLLVYPLNGVGEVYNRNYTFSVKPGELAIAPASKPFGYVPFDDTWRFMWFHLPDDDGWAFLRDQALIVRTTVLRESLQKVMEEFIRESRGRSESSRLAARLYIQLIALYIKRELRSSEDRTDVETGNRLDHLYALINSDLARNWTVETMAAILRVSTPHLHRLVRQHFKMSPMKLVTCLRMERAQEWLIMHDAPQRVIAEMVGYQNEFAFLVAFKRFWNLTPHQFRKQR